MTARYFVETPITGDEAALVDAEAHHAANVMRIKAGELVTLFDGSGYEFAARVAKVGRSEIRLAIEARSLVDRELARDVTLCSALPKGDRQRWLLEKAVELGVRRFVPLRTKRAVVQPDAGACARLRRTVVEASKQCGRNVLMRVDEPQDVAGCVRMVGEEVLRLLASPAATDDLTQAAALAGASRPVAAIIGPEGGLTDEEEAAAVAAGWRPVSLGPRILRIETAAALVCGWAAVGS
jgi:16S rRNA (uracil1498-N3)-methyltransferase